MILQQVDVLRKTQKRLGARKMLTLLNEFKGQNRLSMGRDAFFDLLRENNLLIRKRKRSRPQTTFSYHFYKKYSDLIKGFIPKEPNELWVSDITYIHLEKGYAYLNLITDAYSRKIVGFYLAKDLSAKGTVLALKMAINSEDKRTTKSAKLIHHSDRGLQYCSNEYTKLLNLNFIDISMTQTGDPLDNAIAERVNGILKDELLEEVYPEFNAAQLAVASAISIYNHQRPHGSIDMLTPIIAHQKTGHIRKRWKTYYKRKELNMT